MRLASKTVHTAERYASLLIKEGQSRSDGTVRAAPPTTPPAAQATLLGQEGKVFSSPPFQGEDGKREA